MKLLVVVLLLASCKSKTAPPSISAIDRSCKTDADCTLTGDLSCCGTSCGRDPGVSVNASAWSKVSASFRADCKGDCHVMCAKLPDCRDESFAVCKSGGCDIARRKAAACAPSDPT